MQQTVTLLWTYKVCLALSQFCFKAASLFCFKSSPIVELGKCALGISMVDMSLKKSMQVSMVTLRVATSLDRHTDRVRGDTNT